MNDHSFISPGLVEALASTRTPEDALMGRPQHLEEDKLRELVRAKIRARDAYDRQAMTNVANLTEDQRVDLEIERQGLMRAMFAAEDAVHAYLRAHKQ